MSNAPETTTTTPTTTDEEQGTRLNFASILRTLKGWDERHKAGEPVYAEMAARIKERENDPNGLIAESLKAEHSS